MPTSPNKNKQSQQKPLPLKKDKQSNSSPLKHKSASTPVILPHLIQSSPQSISSPAKNNHTQDISMPQKLRKIRNNYSSLNPKEQPHMLSKEKLIKNLSLHLSSKLKMDDITKQQLNSAKEDKSNRLSWIEKSLQAINKENVMKLKELEQIQKLYIKRIEEEIKKDKEEETKLREEYAKIISQGQKLIVAKEVKKIKEKQDWIDILKQQKSIQLMAKQLQKKQEFIAKEKTHIFKEKQAKKQKIENQSKSKIQASKPSKKQRKQKNAEQLKEMGKQYLEHAKRAQQEKVKSKIKLLDVYKKSIDYLPQIKSILIMNAQDLSKVPDLQGMNISMQKARKKAKINTSSLKNISSLTKMSEK